MQTLAVTALISLCSTWGIPLWVRGAASKIELLEALGNAAATFSRTAPGLGATELLVHLPAQFASHQVSSMWSLSTKGPIHEVRTIRTMDFTPVGAAHAARHAWQSNYTFSYAGRNKIDAEPMLVLRYKQVAGAQAFTELRDRSEKRHPAEFPYSNYTGPVAIP